jgi:putative transcriptional regulator
MNDKRTRRFVYDPANPPQDETNWTRVDGMTDEEINAAAAADPDAPPLSEEELAEFRRTLDPKSVREATGLTQEEFARTFAIPLGTVRDWEQRRTRPDRAAENYLRVIATNPEAAKHAVGCR